ncbi:MAG: GNAT family acetyltransferase [Leucobacter sp.]
MTSSAPGFTIRAFSSEDTDAVIELWSVSGLTKPWNDPKKDIERKLTVQSELFVVAVDHEGRIVGSLMGGYDGHRGSINYLASAPNLRGNGIGLALMQHVEKALLNMGCPKINLQVRPTNDGVVSYYERMGYDVAEIIDLGKRLIED